MVPKCIKALMSVFPDDLENEVSKLIPNLTMLLGTFKTSKKKGKRGKIYNIITI